MSNTVTGVVGKINTRTGTGKRGPWTAYSLVIENDEGPSDDGWYGSGFNKPACAEGDTVEFEAVPSERLEGKWDIEPDSLVVKAKGKGAKKVSTGGKSSGKSSSAQSGGNYDTQAKISYQAARNAAIEFVKTAISAGALVLPKKAADAFAALEAAVDKQTVRYYHDTDTARQLERNADPGALKAKTDAEPAADADASEEDDD